MLFLRQIINATDTKTFLAIGPSWVCLHLNFTLGERPLDRVVCARGHKAQRSYKAV